MKINYRQALRQAWETVHQDRESAEQPLPEVTDFIQALRSRLAPASRAAARVLDAGCGKGRNSPYLASELASIACPLWACDWSVTATRQAAERLARAHLPAVLQAADLTHLPFADAQFDIAICVHVLPCNLQADLFRAVAELRRVLQPGGWLCFDLLHTDDGLYGCGPELEAHTFQDNDQTPLHFSDRHEVDALLAGWRVEKLERIELGPRPRVAWIAWAQKAAC